MRSLPRILGLLGSIALATSVLQAQSAPQPYLPESNPISVSTNLVDLPITVTDRKGNFVDGLAKENFRIFENGRQETISMFGRQDLPVAVGLVVDHSASMGPKLAEVSAAAEAFARSSNPQDHLFVVNFNELVALTLPAAVPFTSDERELRAALAGTGANGQTALYDAVIEALRHLSLSSFNRHALILVTDGGDNASRHTQAQMLDAARMSNAQIYCIGIYNGEEDPDASPRVLRKLAKATGGEANFSSSPAEVTDITRKFVSAVRADFVRPVQDRYDVTVVSPRDHFLFSPWLSQCAVGSVHGSR